MLRGADLDAGVNNAAGANSAAVLACICASTFPNIAVLKSGARRLQAGAEKKILPHGGSALKLHVVKSNAVDDEDAFFVFEELVRGTKLCSMRNASQVSPLCVALFGGHLPCGVAHVRELDEEGDFKLADDARDEHAGEIRMNSWIRLKAAKPLAEKIAVLRLRFEKAFLATIEAGSPGPEQLQVAQDVVAVLTADLMGAAGDGARDPGGPLATAGAASGPSQVHGAAAPRRGAAHRGALRGGGFLGRGQPPAAASGAPSQQRGGQQRGGQQQGGQQQGGQQQGGQQ
jgi:hypothetical protein